MARQREIATLNEDARQLVEFLQQMGGWDPEYQVVRTPTVLGMGRPTAVSGMNIVPRTDPAIDFEDGGESGLSLRFDDPRCPSAGAGTITVELAGFAEYNGFKLLRPGYVHASSISLEDPVTRAAYDEADRFIKRTFRRHATRLNKASGRGTKTLVTWVGAAAERWAHQPNHAILSVHRKPSFPDPEKFPPLAQKSAWPEPVTPHDNSATTLSEFEILHLLEQGQRIAAMKLARESFRLSRMDAKRLIDRFELDRRDGG